MKLDKLFSFIYFSMSSYAKIIIIGNFFFPICARTRPI